MSKGGREGRWEGGKVGGREGGTKELVAVELALHGHVLTWVSEGGYIGGGGREGGTKESVAVETADH